MIEVIYKRVKDAELKLRVFFPKGWTKQDRRPAIIFFFGGGWKGGTWDHFKSHSEYLVSKGMIAITPDYRVSSRFDVTPFDCVMDAKAAVQWVVENAGEIGVDTKKIAVGGGSAGGHLAACTALIKDIRYDPMQVYKVPNAMVLYNPVINTSEKGFGYDRLGDRALEISPVHHVTEGVPATIIFHGTADRTVPFTNVEEFKAEMTNKGNLCVLVPYEGRGHAFFNREKGNEDYSDTLSKTYEFLCSYGYVRS